MLNVQGKSKRNVNKNEEKSIEECSGAYWCRAAAAKGRSSLPKVQRKRKTNRIRKGWWEAVRVRLEVICSQLSCTGGRVEREARGETK